MLFINEGNKMVVSIGLTCKVDFSFKYTITYFLSKQYKYATTCILFPVLHLHEHHLIQDCPRTMFHSLTTVPKWHTLPSSRLLLNEVTTARREQYINKWRQWSLPFMNYSAMLEKGKKNNCQYFDKIKCPVPAVDQAVRPSNSGFDELYLI